MRLISAFGVATASEGLPILLPGGRPGARLQAAETRGNAPTPAATDAAQTLSDRFDERRAEPAMKMVCGPYLGRWLRCSAYSPFFIYCPRRTRGDAVPLYMDIHTVRGGAAVDGVVSHAGDLKVPHTTVRRQLDIAGQQGPSASAPAGSCCWRGRGRSARSRRAAGCASS